MAEIDQVIGPDHKTVAHGADATQIGRDVLTLKDAKGKRFGKALFDKATPKGLGQLRL